MELDNEEYSISLKKVVEAGIKIQTTYLILNIWLAHVPGKSS